MIKQNFLYEAVQWVAISLVLLVSLHFLPLASIGKIQLRRIDILADLAKINRLASPEKKIASIDSTAIKDSLKMLENAIPTAKQNAAKCPVNRTCIDDYSSESNAFGHFAKAIAALQQKKQAKVRVAWFGDSFSEADVVLGILRDSLQQTYGGMGMGFMQITAAGAKVRPTIGHTFANWQTYSVLDKTKSPVALGITGETWLPQGTATVAFKSVEFDGGQARLESVKYWYSDARAGASVSISLDHGAATTAKLTQDSAKLHTLAVAAGGADYINAEWRGKVCLYGASCEGDNGVYLDNFSLRGNPGRKLQVINENLLKQFAAAQNYDLIVLQYGLNVTNADTESYDFYEKEMIPTVQYMQKCFPKASFLLLGVSDRSTHDANGELVSFPSLPKMIATQRRIAQTCGIAFWDTRKAMGGEASMEKWKKNGEANSDYTHLTWSGGKHMARLIFAALQTELSKYKRDL